MTYTISLLKETQPGEKRVASTPVVIDAIDINAPF